MRVLLVGEMPERSAPLLSLYKSLNNRPGIECAFSEGVEYSSTKMWLRLIARHDAIVQVGYLGPNKFMVRQLSLAVIRSIPVVRWWVGTDVLQVLDEPIHAHNARLLSKFVSRQIAVSPHLVNELQGVGIQSEYIPSVIDDCREVVVAEKVPKSILVYMPAGRKEFYGEKIVRAAIEDNPDIAFTIVADDSHSLSGYPNVKSVGWVSDMNLIWDDVGALLRITKHDGMPRMVIDALHRGKYVIYSWPFPGCMLARTLGDVQLAISKFRNATHPNIDGRVCLQNILQEDPVDKWQFLLKECQKGVPFSKKFRATLFLLSQIIASVGGRVGRIFSGFRLSNGVCNE